MSIMDHATWITETKRTAKIRSTELKAVDTALQNYHLLGKSRALLQTLRNALTAWQTATPNWKASIRNHTGAVETLEKQVNAALGTPALGLGAPLVSAAALKSTKLKPPAPVRPMGTSLTTAALVQDFCTEVKDNVHTPWGTLTADARATGMHKALADLFPRMTIPAPGLRLVADLGGAAGQFNFTTWELTVASGPFGKAAPTTAEVLDAAKTIYHEGRHCEQWFHMARYAASGGSLTAAQIRDTLGIPLTIATSALARKMDARDPMFRDTKKWFDSVYNWSGREITLTALGLKAVGDATLLQTMRSGNHQRYASGLPEEADAWGTEALLDSVYVYP